MPVATMLRHPEIWKREEWGPFAAFIRKPTKITTEGRRYTLSAEVRVHRYRGGELADSAPVVANARTVREARLEARKKLRRYMDSLPPNIERMEREYAALRDFFAG